MILPEVLKLEARKELARRSFYDYCVLKYPDFYIEDRAFLKDLADRLQGFLEQNEKRFMVVNLPPRHGKSYTAKNLTEWVFGKFREWKVMTGSYNETLSSTFAKQVRDTIDEKTAGGPVVFNDIFPDTRIKYGEASASMWSLDGMNQKSYLATSPTGTATGFGANLLIIDDIIKNADEAYNEIVLAKHWEWFANTMMQRLEGHDWKVIVIMTRWATTDLAGRVLEAYPDVEHVSYTARQEDGSMLCESILNHNDYLIKTKEMNVDIVEANYNQKPIDVKGRLYSDFIEYDSIPKGEFKKWNYTDTADKGTDFLCSVDYVTVEGNVYVTDVVISDEDMDTTEPLVAAMLHDDEVHEAVIESNNGGRGFSRNIDRILKSVHQNVKCIISSVTQTKNKEARILTSSSWVAKHVWMPHNWKYRWPEFHKQLMSYQRKGKNAHDDAPDVLAAIYEAVANPETPGILGFYADAPKLNKAEPGYNDDIQPIT